MLIPLVPLEVKSFDSRLLPQELLAAVEAQLKDGLVVGIGFLDTKPIEYRGLAHGSHFELWQGGGKLAPGYLPYVHADVSAASGGSKVVALLRPRWDVFLPGGVGALVALVVVRAQDPAFPGPKLLAMLALFHVLAFVLAWLPERMRVVGFLRRLCAAEL